MAGKRRRDHSDESGRPKTDEEVNDLVLRATERLEELRTTFAEIKAVLRSEGVR